MYPCRQASQSVESVGGSFQNFDCSKVKISNLLLFCHKRDLADTNACGCSKGCCRENRIETKECSRLVVMPSRTCNSRTRNVLRVRFRMSSTT